MPSKYGINVELINGSLKAYEIQNSRPIALCGDDTKLSGLNHFSTITEALEAVGEGSIKNALDDLKAVSFGTQIIISAFELANETRSSQENVNLCLEAINALALAEATLGIKPKFILATEYNDDGVREALKTMAAKLRAVYAFELDEKTEAAITQKLTTIQFNRGICAFQKVKRLDSVIRPASAFLIGNYAKVMASSEYGFSESFSNRVIDGIIAVIDPVEHIQGSDCVSDRMRGAGVTCIIVDNGIRAWGGEIRDDDYSSLHTMVIFDTAIETIFEAQKSAIDKKIKDVLGNVVDSLREFYRNLVGANVIVGYEVEVPTDINTNTNIAEGKIYIVHKAQEMPLLKNLTNKIYRVTEYSEELIREL